VIRKDRIDQILVERGLVASREKGRALIMAGQVYVNKLLVDKPGTKVLLDDHIEIKGKISPYVSRGGIKLEKGLREFDIVLKDKIVIDIGASTGGFTQCALLQGASRVYAVDVGYGQLDWSLRQDERVICLERTNARYLTTEKIPEMVDVITIDASFISLSKIFPTIKNFLKEDGIIIALIKPQFEAGREKVGKKGVVKEIGVHIDVLDRIIAEAWENGLKAVGLTYSPIKGPEGNIEFILCLKNNKELEDKINIDMIKEVTARAHESL